MIEPRERRALNELRRLDWAPTQDDVWSRLDFHIEPLNGLSRTVTVVACLPSSWTLIEQNAVASVGGRFRTETRLARLPSAEIATELVTARRLNLFAPTR